MNNKKMVGNGSKATLPNGQKLSDKIQENKTKQSVENKKGRGTNSTSTNANQPANNGEKQKSKGMQNAQAAGTEAAREALKKAAGTIPWTKWIPKGIRDKIIDRFMDSDGGQAAVEKALNKVKVSLIMIIVGAIASVAMSLLSIAAIYAMIAAPVGWISDALGDVGKWFASLGNWFVGDGWCPTESECQNLAYNEYYEKLSGAVNNYSGKCEINEDLITATIFYGQMVSQEKIESGKNENDNNENKDDDTFYYDYLDVSEKAGRQSAKSQINKLLRVYLKGENVDLNSTDDNELDLSEDSACVSSVSAYRRYLVDNYIDWAYPSVITEDRTKEQIADEIMTMGNIALINKAYSSSIYCNSISVIQENGEIESMDLEEYVARVVTKENSWYEGDNIENMKAQAIAARTYALNYTNNCKNTIKNSASVQTLADTPNMMAIRAAEETNSLVLLKDGKVFSTQYDALAIDYNLTEEKNDDNYYLKQASLPISKVWLDANVTQSQYEYYKNHNHGNGMSQWGSRYLQHIGKNYEQILNTFYTMAEITKMGGLISGGNYSSNSGPAVDISDLQNRANTVITTSNRSFNLYSSQTGLISQCSWFARNRSMEIIYYSDMPDDIKNTAINSLMATSANGGEWYDKSDGTIFTKTTDYTQPIPGSMAVWTSSCHRYGHVAIVEQVYESNGQTMILLSETWNKADIHAANNWGNTYYQIKERNLDYMKSHTNSSGCVSSFVGYVYLLG